MFLCALVGPLFPPPPTLCLLYVSFLCVRLFCCFFFVSPCSRSPLLPRALRVPSALLRATPVPQPRAPSLARLPSHSLSRCRPCLYVCTSCLSRAVTRVCHPRALPLLLSVAPTLLPPFFFYVDQFKQSFGPGHHRMLSTLVEGITYPTLVPGVSPTLVLPRSPSLTPSWLPCALCWEGCICGLDCGPARGLARPLCSYAP